MKNDIFQLWNKMHGIKMEKKYSTKQLVPIIYTLGKGFFAPATFLHLLNVYELLLFRQRRKCSILWYALVFFAFQSETRLNKSVSWGEYLSFCRYLFRCENV